MKKDDLRKTNKEFRVERKINKLKKEGIKFEKKETKKLAELEFDFSQKCAWCGKYCDCIHEFTNICCQCRSKKCLENRGKELPLEKFCETCMIRVTLMGG